MLTNPTSDLIVFQTSWSCLFPNNDQVTVKKTNWETLMITLHTVHGEDSGILKKPTTIPPQES